MKDLIRDAIRGRKKPTELAAITKRYSKAS